MNSGLAWQILVVVLKMLFFIQFSVQKLEPFLRGTEGFSLESFRAKGKLLRPDTRALTLVCTFCQGWLKPFGVTTYRSCYLTQPGLLHFRGGNCIKKDKNMCLRSLEGLKVSLLPHDPQSQLLSSQRQPQPPASWVSLQIYCISKHLSIKIK